MPKLSISDKTAKVSQNEARRRKEVALAELREMERDVKKGKLIDAEKVRDTWASVAGKLRDAVLRIPDKCAPVVITAADAAEARAILQTECEGILRALHDELSQPA
ncbi:hypothetical protein [uncultured Paludibaculum sp.]|uniref:hypothetical protein n=1 Tax=uncultured Paludibaculum sp. TaxID=1765020 RepID=UPI002AAA8DFE|nr:hypothetical protein [uncultured Paludibaculum sp.]